MGDHGIAALKKNGLIPDVLDEFKPTGELSVSFAHGKKADHGNVLHPVDVFDGIASISWPTEAGALYTLVKTDPDAPSRADPKWREWCHYIVGNIPGNDLKKGEVIWDYVGVGAPEKTGLHRYTYIVYKQAGKVDYSATPKKTNAQAKGRGGFKVRDFAKQHKLTPIAVNHFQAEWDDSVPKLYALFKD